MSEHLRRPLVLHPDCRCDAVQGIEVEVVRSGAGALALNYVLVGNIADLLIPPATAPGRAEGLWEHSCFEAFLRHSPEDYHEFNFAPSTQWAAYRFSGYRSGKEDAAIPPPRIAVDSDPGRLQLRAEIDLTHVAGEHLGLSAVIEETNGRKSYWALAHPPGKADFHHPACFALQLPAA